MDDSSGQLTSFSTFGDLLKYLRVRVHLTQRELAIAVGYSESQISRLEANQRTPDRTSLIAHFISVLAIKDEPETIARLLELAGQNYKVAGNQIFPNNKQRSNKSPHAAIVQGKAHLHNLPIQLTSFIGREKEIAALRRLITTRMSHLVTLTGSGGVGKTRLAIRVAEELFDYFGDGVWFVELAHISNPELVPQAIAAELSLMGSTGLPILEVLTSYLKSRDLLLVLDNCEHLVAACAGLVDHLLHACPNLVILATSREALRVAGEHTYRVPSLAIPDSRSLQPIEELAQFEAVRLFTDRATASWQAFELTTQNAPAVVEICRRLDGIPLAIELAGARVGVMSVEQIQDRLNHCFRLLSTGPRTVFPRHQTLRASIDWSYNLLSPGERLLVQRLSVFSGGWTLEAAEAVCAFDGIEDFEVLDLLTSLVNKSLVIVIHETVPQPGSAVRGNVTRYRMLETIRQFAAEQLAGEKPPDTHFVNELKRRHLAYFARLIEPAGYELLGPKQIAWVELLTGDLENIRAALNWGLGTGVPGIIEDGLRLVTAPLYFWYFFGLGEEAYSWLSAGLDYLTRQVDAPPALVGKTYKTTAVSLYTMGDIQKSREFIEESIALFRTLGRSYDLAEALIWFAFIGSSQAADNMAIANEAVEVARQVGDPGLLGVCLFTREGSRHDLEESIRILERNGDALFLSDPNRSLGHLARMNGDYALARSCLQKTLAINQKYFMKLQITFDFIELAELAFLEGQYSQMELDAQACLNTAEEISFRYQMGKSLYYLGVAARRQDHLNQAALRFHQGLALAREYRLEDIALVNLAGLAGIELEYGGLADSVKLLGVVAANGLDAFEDITRLEIERDQAKAKSQMLDEDFLSAREEGRAMTLDQAIQYMLEEGKL